MKRYINECPLRFRARTFNFQRTGGAAMILAYWELQFHVYFFVIFVVFFLLWYYWRYYCLFCFGCCVNNSYIVSWVYLYLYLMGFCSSSRSIIYFFLWNPINEGLCFINGIHFILTLKWTTLRHTKIGEKSIKNKFNYILKQLPLHIVNQSNSHTTKTIPHLFVKQKNTLYKINQHVPIIYEVSRSPYRLRFLPIRRDRRWPHVRKMRT